jgi:DMSO/TMAO reductase YedYZ molybdopterin-dependent catalytic subunit
MVCDTMVVERSLPPGQREVRKWPRLDLGIVPRFDANAWDLRVDGAVGKPLRFTFDELVALPSTKTMSAFHCVTGWTTFDNEWVGVTIRELAERAQIRPTARFATFRCGDGYTTSHPLDALYDPGVLLTYQWDGKPLPLEHGGPVRLLVPKRYAYKSAKWVRAVTFTEEEELGYWEIRGYSNTADPWTEDRYSF